MGIHPENLKATIEHYNEMCETGVDSEFFKDPEQMLPFTKGPFYAVSGGLGTDGAFGGVLVDENIRAFSKDGGLVTGLFVPGDFSSGRYLNIRNNKVQIINDLSWAFASGWLAAGSAVDFLNR
jgi:fumarate reductase flavoprotein subunit